jgi:hypothetical protein
MKQFVDGSQHLDIGRLDFVLTKEPFDIMASYVNSFEICVKKYTNINFDKNTKKIYDRAGFKKKIGPSKNSKTSLLISPDCYLLQRFRAL